MARFDDLVIALQGITVVCSVSLPTGCIVDAHIAASAGVAASKLEHQHVLTYKQDDGTDIAAAIVPIYTVRGATAEIIEFEVACLDAPSGGDKKFTVDLQKCDDGTPTPATVLSAVLDSSTYGSAPSTDCEVGTGVISSADLVVGDILVVVVAISGSTGTQGQGLIVTATIREDAE
jgi:hypothetical protein